MTLPIADDASEQVGALEKWVLFDRRTAKQHVRAASGSLNLPVQVKPKRSQPFVFRKARDDAKRLVVFLPGLRRWKIQLQHARIGRKPERRDGGCVCRPVSAEHEVRRPLRNRDTFDEPRQCRERCELERWDEDVKSSLGHLDRERSFEKAIIDRTERQAEPERALPGVERDGAFAREGPSVGDPASVDEVER